MKKQRLEDAIVGTIGGSALKGIISGKSLFSKITNTIIMPSKDVYKIMGDYFKTSDYKVYTNKTGKSLKIINKNYLMVKFGIRPILSGITKTSISHISKDTLEGKMTIGPIRSKYYTAAVYVKKDPLTDRYKYNNWKYFGTSVKP